MIIVFWRIPSVQQMEQNNVISNNIIVQYNTTHSTPIGTVHFAQPSAAVAEILKKMQVWKIKAQKQQNV